MWAQILETQIYRLVMHYKSWFLIVILLWPHEVCSMKHSDFKTRRENVFKNTVYKEIIKFLLYLILSHLTSKFGQIGGGECVELKQLLKMVRLLCDRLLYYSVRNVLSVVLKSPGSHLKIQKPCHKFLSFSLSWVPHTPFILIPNR